MIIGKKEFKNDRTHIMGILNVTPDSFSDGGLWSSLSAALRRTEQMIEEGAEIIDIGGESTRPGYTKIPDEEEIRRVVPVIRAIKTRFDVPVSIDTYKGAVTLEALYAGADLVNSIWGFKYDTKQAEHAHEFNVPVCLSHNRESTEYNDFVTDVKKELLECVDIAKAAGIPDEKIILDPGVGFGKTVGQNLSIMNHLEDVIAMGYPVLIGTSRKSVIGVTLGLPPDQRLEGTLATTVMAVIKGTMFLRVHDIKENVRAVKMIEAIKNC